MGKVIGLRPRDDMADWLHLLAQFSHSPSATAAGFALDLVRDSCARELRKTPWTIGEARLLAQVRGGWMMDLAWGGLMLADVQDELAAMEQAYGCSAAGYGVADVDALIGKLAGMSPLGDFALRFALARWWSGEKSADREGFEAVGLRIIDDVQQTP